MFKSAGARVKTVAALSLASALTVGGVAAAQPGGGASHHGSRRGPESGQTTSAPGESGGAPLGIPIPGFTYAEVHVEHEGASQVIRLDEGKIVSVSESSITLSENGGGEVSIPLDASTTVRGRPGSEASVSDLKEGQLVIVCGPQGGDAKSVVIVPKGGVAPAGTQGRRPRGGEGGAEEAGEGEGA